MTHLSSSNWFGPLFSSQYWTNFENMPKNGNFSMYFDNFCSFFECHSILAGKQRTKQTNHSSLSYSTSLDTQNTFQGGIIAEWMKFWQEIPVAGVPKQHVTIAPSSRRERHLTVFCIDDIVLGYVYVYLVNGWNFSALLIYFWTSLCAHHVIFITESVLLIKFLLSMRTSSYMMTLAFAKF